MRLSEDLRKWRAERPDEWTMDRFIQEATRLEALEEKFTSANKQSDAIATIESKCDKILISLSRKISGNTGPG